MTTMRVYVGTYGKYNSGSIEGAWLDLEDYSDKEEFYAACAELHSNEEDPEFMFQDWEGIPDGFISESSIEAECWDLIEAYEEHGEEAVTAYCDCFGEWDAEDFQDRYRGNYAGWREMVEELLDETGELQQIPENLRYYFDYDAYANDLRCGGDMCESSGHFFWNH